ncbi:MAG: NAD-dependent protein deacylase [Defluviitaleaceae bacterium]|nr:NAD-dependent protein deacylase [Defluviitaleaceae bacterium]
MTSVEKSANALRDIINNSPNIVFFGGAGVSTESNIPDFRSENGLFTATQRYGYPPEQLLSRTFFDNNPELFFQYYKENLIHPDAKPNGAHLALAALEQQGKLRAVITQNVDGLHQAAGSHNVLELHGTNHAHYCVNCQNSYTLGYAQDTANCEIFVPKCSKCGATVRPGIVLYEEALDENVMQAAVEAISAADCVIVGGTSLMVYPAAGLLRYFKGRNLVLINRTQTPYDNQANLVIRDSIAEVLALAIG